jgi:H+/Cl- antiporter ClcA
MITLSLGGSGGIITPIFFIGATAGTAFATVFGLDKATFGAIGLVGLLAGAANTPIAASIMAMELFGPKIAPYAAVACVVSFLISGHRSVYPSQVLSIRKSSSVIVETGKAVEGLKVHVEPRKKSLSANIFRMARVVIKILYKKE